MTLLLPTDEEEDAGELPEWGRTKREQQSSVGSEFASKKFNYPDCGIDGWSGPWQHTRWSEGRDKRRMGMCGESEHGLQIGYQFNIIVNIIPNLLDIPTGSAFIDVA